MIRQLAFLVCCLVFLPAASADETPRPNIIVIFTDDHGWSDLGRQGIRQDLRTPHLDALADGGVRMSSGYVTAPQCVPSRAGLLTGKYQPRFGVESNRSTLDGFNRQRTIAQRLRTAGYTTGMAGKWHLGPVQEITAHGFDDVYCTQGRPWANFDLEGNSREGGYVADSPYHLHANSAAAVAFIQRHHDRPFFFYLAYRAPHVPLDAPEKYLARFPGEMPRRRRQALAMLSAVDDGVGAVVKALRDNSIEQRTLIFFISDNGAPLKIHKLDAPGGGPGWDGSLNDPLNGEKGMLSEGGIRVPFLMYWKGKITPGRVYDQPVISLDVASTAAALAGFREDPELDGVNLLPYVTGERQGAPHESLYWRWIAQSAVREGKWKYLRGGTREYLFDVAADPYEKQSLLRQHPNVAARLRTRLEGWAGTLSPPGLATGRMAETWERYFDHYLDGKTIRRPDPAASGGKAAGGWIARNAIVTASDEGLQLTPSKVGRQKPFLACSRFKIPGPVTATIQLRSDRGGKAGFAWRLEGQKDFPVDQVARFDVRAEEDWQEIKIDLPAQGALIHLRVLLPDGVTSIRRIRLDSPDGNRSQQWNFAKK